MIRVYKIFILLVSIQILVIAQKGTNEIQLQTIVHQTLVREAYKLLLMEHPEIACPMDEYIGTGEKSGPWTTGKVVAGAYREDEEDVVYQYYGLFGEYITMSHFWNADLGDNHKFNYMAKLFNNAYQKARVFIYGQDTDGNKKIYIDGYRLSNESVCAPTEREGLYISYNSLFDFYNTGTYYVEGFRIYGDDFFPPRCGPYTLGQYDREIIVWEILGRVTHLLADMGVPAHAHNDIHAVDTDEYENDYMTTSMASNYDKIMATNDGGVIYVQNKYDPLRYLFYTVNQVADWFDSGVEGFEGLHLGDNNYNPNFQGDYYQELDNKMQQLGTPTHSTDHDKTARNAYIMSMRATAGLLHWFAKETNQFTTVTTSGNLSHDETWGNVSLDGDVIVPSGKILTLCGGKIIMNGHSIVSTGGIIELEGNVRGNFVKLKSGSTIKALYPTVQQAVDNANSYWDIELLSNTTYSGNVTLTNKYNVDITGEGSSSYINGSITLTNSDYSDLKDLRVNYISTNNSRITIDHVSGIHRFSFYGDNVYFNHSSTNGGGQIPNQITNTDGNIYYSNIQSMLIGADLESGSIYHINQTYFCSNDVDVMAYNGSTGYVYYNDPYSYNPAYSCVGNIIFSGGTNTCGSSGFLKSTINSDLSSKEKDDLTEIDNTYANILEKVNKDKDEKGEVDMKKYESDYNDVITDYKSFLEKYPSSVEAPTAIFRTIHCYQQQDDYKGYNNFINTFLADKKYDAIRPHVERHNIDLNVEEGNYKEAIDVANKIIKSYKIDDDLYCELLYEKGLIYKYHLEDKESAEMMFKTIVDKYPENKMVSYAEIELGTSATKDEKGEIKETETLKQNSFEINSYPNPFNPSTTLSYYLPSASVVKLEIYDVMGRMIKSFSTNAQSSGTHQVIWDGTNSNGSRVSTGIYIYRFEATSLETNEHFVKSEKLMLIK